MARLRVVLGTALSGPAGCGSALFDHHIGRRRVWLRPAADPCRTAGCRPPGPGPAAGGHFEVIFEVQDFCRPLIRPHCPPPPPWPRQRPARVLAAAEPPGWASRRPDPACSESPIPSLSPCRGPHTHKHKPRASSAADSSWAVRLRARRPGPGLGQTRIPSPTGRMPRRRRSPGRWAGPGPGHGADGVHGTVTRIGRHLSESVRPFPIRGRRNRFALPPPARRARRRRSGLGPSELADPTAFSAARAPRSLAGRPRPRGGLRYVCCACAYRRRRRQHRRRRGHGPAGGVKGGDSDGRPSRRPALQHRAVATSGVADVRQRRRAAARVRTGSDSRRMWDWEPGRLCWR